MTRTPSSLVVDSWAWLELFSGSDRGKRVEKEIEKAEKVFTSAISLAEVVSVATRRKRPTEEKIAVIRSQSVVLVPSSDDAVEAGLLHAEAKAEAPGFSLADAFVLQAARKLGARVLTGDPDFRGIKDAELI